MEFLIFILVVSIVFGIQAFIAAQFSVIAEEKGYPEAKYFWFCVFNSSCCLNNNFDVILLCIFAPNF